MEALKEISELTGVEFRHAPRRVHGSPEPYVVQGAIRIDVYPAFDLYPQLDYVCVSTSKGCPFKCPYCASPYLNQGFYRKDPGKVVEEIEYWTTRYSVQNIAFYDDALLFNPSEHFIPLMREVIRKGIPCQFHAPNGLHIREINDEVAELLFRGGF